MCFEIFFFLLTTRNCVEILVHANCMYTWLKIKKMLVYFSKYDHFLEEHSVFKWMCQERHQDVNVCGADSAEASGLNCVSQFSGSVLYFMRHSGGINTPCRMSHAPQRKQIYASIFTHRLREMGLWNSTSQLNENKVHTPDWSQSHLRPDSFVCSRHD